MVISDPTRARAFAALVAGLFAFGGWHMVTYTAGETLRPEKTIPRALLLGTLIVTVSYMALNAVYFRVLPLDVVVSSTRVAADTADAVMGAGGAATVSGLVILSTFGALSGIVLAGPRVYYSMSRDGLLFGWIGEIHPRYRTPHRAIALHDFTHDLDVGLGGVIDDEDFAVRLGTVLHEFAIGDDRGILLLAGVIHEVHFLVGLGGVVDHEDFGGHGGVGLRPKSNAKSKDGPLTLEA